mmetsp:Transcript_1465/g.2084  ORF Transcript_1465/g.2084 Transcript_1465/m.2084 type:complete len:414 (+) Transcript_1465:356-1597(+)|eukprot:CAMPEP_0167750014 /NCGR_PEP_ID=MMETSP0110_2-20121227/5746_1 /TAXON_ID=629695 /ORGANISM="Gymnochlora sp., Strain CCMP2014" /LENGTH=413 /DNA_ID=CAMNT_0007635269 /DNA_START=339 /DNA_END=1580 /DNA_ORIENTATION=-
MQRSESSEKLASEAFGQLRLRRRVPAFLFDIDGVFKRGSIHSESGAEALRRVVAAKLPFAFVTNGGGGRTEAQYATELGSKLLAAESKTDIKDGELEEKTKEGQEKGSTDITAGSLLEIRAEQMILSYSPFKSDLEHLKPFPTLIVGSYTSLFVARQYGFKKAVHIEDYAHRNPLLNPFSKRTPKKMSGKCHSSEGFGSVLIFSDPVDYFEAMQIVIDVLLSKRPDLTEFDSSHRIPVVFSAGDLLWKSQHPNPRFGQGAFRIALESLYVARMRLLSVSEREIKARLGDFVQYGKPTLAQFRHARGVLLSEAERLGCEISKVYMIGDNPRTDIHGAQKMHRHIYDNHMCHLSKAENKTTNGKDNLQKRQPESWSGILVRTGVYTDGDDTFGAEKVFDDVLQCVEFVRKRHGHM